LLTRHRYDDLLEEERVAHKIALDRLSPREQYDRVYRIRRSVQCSVQHKLLPREQWTKPEDVRYPKPPPVRTAAQDPSLAAVSGLLIAKWQR
jgi:ubiquinol-cytochrome c reductase subunit 7